MTKPKLQEKSDLPRHVGYIVDGNRRWSKQHSLLAYEGHLAGYNVIKDIAIATFEAGVQYMSAYIFSTENWKRSSTEVKKLMSLVLRLLTTDLHLFDEHNIKLKILGTKDGLSPKIIKAIEAAEARTANNGGGTLALCFNYGGQLEVVDAVKKIVHSGVEPGDITIEMLSENMYAPDVPPVDLLVRTSGEQRLSNFMLWRSAYSELIFLDKNWPDMTKADVAAILKEYLRRNRRFGG